MSTEVDSDEVTARANFELKPGQVVYSLGHGACIFVEVERTRIPRENSVYKIKLPFSGKDNHTLSIFRKFLKPPVGREIIIQAINVFRNHETIPLSSPADINKILEEYDIPNIARVAVTLGSLAPSAENQIALDKVYDRLTGVMAAWALSRQQSQIREALEGNRPEILSLLGKMRYRINLALAGKLIDADEKHIFALNEDADTRFNLAAKRLTASPAQNPSGDVMSAAAIADMNTAATGQKVSHTDITTLAGPTAKQITNGRELPAFHYPFCSERGKNPQQPPKAIAKTL